jgi:Secretion system C-terminal sorting domain
MKKTITLLALCLICTLSFAQQAPAIQWQKCLGGTGDEYANSIQPTPDGGYIVAGYTSSIDGDVTGNQGETDAWIMKLNSTGNLQWQKTMGGTSADSASCIQTTSDGGYIVAGYTLSTNGDVTGNHGGNDIWVVKISSTGSLQWEKAFGGTNFDYASSIQVTADSGYILAGYTTSIDGDVTGNQGDKDVWIVKISSSGSLQWQKTLGGANLDQAKSIQPTSDGGYIVAGYTNSTNGDVTGNHGDYDVWVVKLSGSGSLLWQKALGGTNFDGANSIQPTADGGYIVAGYTASNNGDVTGNHGNGDGWVVKLSSTGSLQWQKAFGGTDGESFYSIQPTLDGGYIVAGETSSSDGDLTGNHGDYDVWAVKLSNTGSLQWQKTLGGISWDLAYNIQSTPDEGYIVAGFTSSTDEDVTGNHGNDDAWVVKLGPALSIAGFEKEAIMVYPNPSKTMLTVQNSHQTPFDKIVITDNMGKIVLTQTAPTSQVNVAALANGIYIVTGFSGEEQLVSKFVKE